MSDLKRCLTGTGLRVHLTRDPRWKWFSEEKKTYPMGYTLCRRRISRVLHTYDFDDPNEPGADVRPADCIPCRKDALRDIFRNLMTIEGFDLTYEQAQRARCELTVPSSEIVDEVIRLVYGNAEASPALPTE